MVLKILALVGLSFVIAYFTYWAILLTELDKGEENDRCFVG